MKLGIVGNFAIDRYLLNPQDIETARKLLQRQKTLLEMGQKLVVANIEELLKNLNSPSLIRLGGGGYNSLEAFLKFNTQDSVDYYDLSHQPELKLTQNRRVSYHFGTSRISRSLILEKEGERAIAKTSRYDQNYELSEAKLASFRRLIWSWDALLANSMANYTLARTIGGEYGGKKYVVVTKNLSLEDLRATELLKDSTAIIDVEEALILGAETNKSKKNIQDTINILQSLGARRAIVTLGKEGAAYYEEGMTRAQISGVKKHIENGKVLPHLQNYGIKKNCAGDYFAAALLHYLESGRDLDESVIQSHMFVIKERFRYPSIKESDFSIANL